MLLGSRVGGNPTTSMYSRAPPSPVLAPAMQASSGGYPGTRPQGIMSAPAVNAVSSRQFTQTQSSPPPSNRTVGSAVTKRPSIASVRSSQLESTPGKSAVQNAISRIDSRVSSGDKGTTKVTTSSANVQARHQSPLTKRPSPPSSPGIATRTFPRRRAGSGELANPTPNSPRNSNGRAVVSNGSGPLRTVSGASSYTTTSSSYARPSSALVGMSTGLSTGLSTLGQRRTSLGAISEVSTMEIMKEMSASPRGTQELQINTVQPTSIQAPRKAIPVASLSLNQQPKVVRWTSLDKPSEPPMIIPRSRRTSTCDTNDSTEMGFGPVKSLIQRPVVGTQAFKIGTLTLKLMPENDRNLAVRITELLQNRDNLKKPVVQCFNEAAQGCESLDLDKLQVFRNLLPSALDVESDAFDDLCSEYIRFDFDGTGQIGVNAAYKLVKYHLFDHHKRLAAAPVTANVANKDLKTAGYTVIRELGAGNQGTAKLVTDRQGKRRCLKCYNKAKMSSGAVEELRQEFEALKLLQCENIASVIEIFQDSNFYYLVGEAYLGGNFTTLKEKALAAGVATEDWFKNVFRQCFEALVFMHEQAMMHCDIKEPNLMLRSENVKKPRVVVIDLGVSRCMATVDNGMPHGTPGYVPPETLETRKWFPRGDVFSLGVCICQIMCDKLPPTGERDRNTLGGIFIEGCMTVREIFQATKNRVAPLHLMPPDMPLLADLVEKLLVKKHEERPTAPAVLNEDWFREGRQGASTWTFADKFDQYNARSRFASVGITPSFLAEMGEDDMTAFAGSEQAKALLAASKLAQRPDYETRH